MTIGFGDLPAGCLGLGGRVSRYKSHWVRRPPFSHSVTSAVNESPGSRRPGSPDASSPSSGIRRACASAVNSAQGDAGASFEKSGPVSWPPHTRPARKTRKGKTNFRFSRENCLFVSTRLLLSSQFIAGQLDIRSGPPQVSKEDSGRGRSGVTLPHTFFRLTPRRDPFTSSVHCPVGACLARSLYL